MYQNTQTFEGTGYFHVCLSDLGASILTVKQMLFLVQAGLQVQRDIFLKS